MPNTIQRFLLENLDIRGAVVRLDTVWKSVLAGRHYPLPVVRTLGEIAAISVLLSDNLKQEGRLTLQLRGRGAVSLLVVDCGEGLNLRAAAHYEAQKILTDTLSLQSLLGQGELLLSYSPENAKEPYQSIVPLSGTQVSSIFEHYLTQSEQIESRIFLSASSDGIAGIYVQKMPSADEKDPDGWTRVEALFKTLTPEDMNTLSIDTLLTRLFNEETVRLFEGRNVKHHFPMDWDKIRMVLKTLGREEVNKAFQEAGELVICDELSNHEYRFDEEDIKALFSELPVNSEHIH